MKRAARKHTMPIIKFFTEEELAAIAANKDIWTKEKIENIPQLSSNAKRYYDYYERMIQHGSNDNNAAIVNEKIKVMQNTAPQPILPNYIVEGDYTLAILPAGTELYKATPWFYTDLPAEQCRWWFANSPPVAARYLANDFAGFGVYRTTRDVRSFIFTRANLEKLYADMQTEPNCEHLRFLLGHVFGIGISTFDKLALRGPVMIITEVECPEPVERLDAFFTEKHNFQKYQTELYDYLEQKFGCQGTILPAHIDPVCGYHHGEITAWTNDLELIKDHQFYWENWGLQLPGAIRQAKFNYTDYDNVNFRAVNWLAYHRPIQHSKILVVDFNYATPCFEADICVEVIKFIKKVKPEYVYLLHAQGYKEKICQAIGYNSWYFGRGSLFFNTRTKITTGVANFGTKQNKFVTLNIGKQKVAFVSVPEKPYVSKRKVEYPEKFEQLYTYNRDIKAKHWRAVLQEKPDSIIGNLNVSPIDLTDLAVLRDYTNMMPDANTNFRGLNSSWYFAKQPKNAKVEIYDFPYLPNRPIGINFTI